MAAFFAPKNPGATIATPRVATPTRPAAAGARTPTTTKKKSNAGKRGAAAKRDINIEDTDNESDGTSVAGSTLSSMIDDRPVVQGVGLRDVPFPEEFEQMSHGGSASQRSSRQPKVHVRSEHRPLLELYEIGNYGDHLRNFCHNAHVLMNFPVPYALWSHTNPENRSAYVPPSAWKWLMDKDKQKTYRELFAFHHILPGDFPVHERTVTPLRKMRRMAANEDSAAADAQQYSYIPPTLEVILCNNTVHEPNYLNRHVVEEISHEFAVLGDHHAEGIFRHGAKHGGNPGCSSVVFFNIDEQPTHLKSDDDMLKLMSQCTNCFGGVDMNMPNFNPAVNTEYTSTFIESKRMRDVYVKQGRAFEDKPDSSVNYLHPTLVKKACEARGLDADEQDIRHMLHSKSRTSEHSSHFGHTPSDIAEEGTAHNQHKFITCFMHVVPCVVRDSTGKRRLVVVEILRISSRVLGCDPAVALHQLIVASNSEDLQNPLIRIVRRMTRLLEMDVDVNVTDLFNSSHSENLVSIALDANIPLAFFNYLKQNKISSNDVSMFAADYMGMRIDVWNDDEVRLYREGLHIAKISRRELYRVVLQNVLADIQNPRNAKLPILSNTHDFRMFFPGMHWRAIPRDVLDTSVLECLDRNSASGTRTDFDEITNEINLFNDQHSNEDDTMVYIPVDGFPHLNGYAFRMNPVQQSKVKFKSSFAAHTDSEAVERDKYEVQPLLYSSKQYGMFCENVCSREDISRSFLDPSSPDVFDQLHMHKRSTELSITENIFWKAMNVNENEYQSKPNKSMLQVEAIMRHYGLKGSSVQFMTEDVLKNSDVRNMWSNVHRCIEQEIAKFVYSANMSNMQHLKYAGKFISELKQYDTDTEFSSRIFQTHLRVLQQVRDCDATNDDTVAAIASLRSFEHLYTALNFTNSMNFRWMQGAVLSIWADTSDGCYGYCIQLSDGGNSFRVFQPPSKPRGSWTLTDWDAKSPGAGADTIFNLLGEILNAFGKHLCKDSSIRDFCVGNPVCNLHRTKTIFSMMRMCGICLDNHGCIVNGMSEHMSCYGAVGAFLEVAKLQANEEEKKRIWPTFESCLGQSGSTNRGVIEKTHSTTHHGVPLSIIKTNPLQTILLASNLLSQFRPPSVNEGSRVVGAMSGIMDDLGIITTTTSSQAQTRSRNTEIHTFDQCDKRFDDIVCITTAVIYANMTYFLLEHMNRVLSFMHRSTRVQRLLWNKFTLIDMSILKDMAITITHGLRRHTFALDDRMSRNFNGSFETAAVGKWMRNVTMTCMNRRLQLTTLQDGVLLTRLGDVMNDAYKTYVMVPPSVTVLLSALHLYLSVVILDVNVMVVTCMSLYYMNMTQGCPLHVLALAASDQIDLASEAEREQYHVFCEFLCRKLFSDIVTEKCLVSSDAFDQVNARALAEGQLNALQQAVQYGTPSSSNHNSVYVSSLFFEADPNLYPIDDGGQKRDAGGNRKQNNKAQFAAWFAEHQTLQCKQTNDFWKHAVQGTRMPQSSAAGDVHVQFQDPNTCYKWYLAVHDSLNNAEGAIVSFLRLCKCHVQCNRRELLERILKSHFLMYPRDKRFFLSAVQPASGESKFWSEPIVDRHTKSVTNDMFSWCMRVNSARTGLEVSMAMDVLWVILGQALFAGEWTSVAGNRSVVVHNRNMANAAEVLTFLFMHTSLPNAYIPANVGGVIISEPSHVLKHKNRPVCLPYHPTLHVDMDDSGNCFLSKCRRDPMVYTVVHTHENVPIAVLAPIVARNAFNHNKIHTYQLSPYPPEATAHMLPYLQQLQDADEAYRNKANMHAYADCTWPLSTRLLGHSITAENSMHLPVFLTQVSVQEEIPCFTYGDGFAFVLLRTDDGFTVHPVHNIAPSPDYYQGIEFKTLPLRTDTLEFPLGSLSFTMRQGLVQGVDGNVYYSPPPMGAAPPVTGEDRVLPFAMYPIIRCETVLLIRYTTDMTPDVHLESFGENPSNTREQLSMAVLVKHPDTNTYLKQGHYFVRYFDMSGSVVEQSLDFIFGQRCMLMDGHSIFWNIKSSDYEDMIRDIHGNKKNNHLRGQAFTLDQSSSSDSLYLQCFYTLAHHTPSELGDTKIQIMFSIKDRNSFNSNEVSAYYDIPLFDSSCNLNVHTMPPEDTSLIITHFVFD